MVWLVERDKRGLVKCVMEAGDRIGAYRVLRRLGAGGMGEVYEAEGGDGARLLSRLSHPRLVKMHDFGVDDATERPYLAMDLVLRADGCAKKLAEVTPNEADEAQLALWFRDLASVPSSTTYTPKVSFSATSS